MSRNSAPNSFNPLSLFSASEPGFWYDYSDFSTLFQDSAGTTPVTATGQAVGAGVHEVQRFPTKGPGYVSVIAAGSTGDIQFTPGSGV